MALHQNKSETTKAIKESKTLCACTTREAEADQAMLISKSEAQYATCAKEAKANCASITVEVENCCSMAIRKVESHGAKQACSIQQSRAKGMQHLEIEAIGEKGKDCLSFLTAHGAALWASHPKNHGVLVTPFHLLSGNVHLSTLLNIPPQYLPLDINLSHKFLILLPPWHLDPWPHPNGDTPLPARLYPLLNWKPPHLKRRDEMPLHKALTGGWQEAFARGSELVWKAREEHCKTNCPHFDLKTSHDLMNIFQNMITSASLLGSKIYEIQESWEGQSELWYANDTLRALPKGLQIFHAISPSGLPKVMGLAGIHNPDALCHFSGMTFCPWCGKEGQNEGTIVNHLQMTHYKLGLVCGTCFHCPSVTSKAIWHQIWKSFQHPQGEDRGLDDTSSSA